MFAVLPSAPALAFHSITNQRCNWTPILATVRLYRILQLAVCICCPGTRTFTRSFDAGIQVIVSSVITLIFSSTRNQRGNCTRISLLSWTAVHLPVHRSILGSKASFHLLQHCFSAEVEAASVKTRADGENQRKTDAAKAFPKFTRHVHAEAILVNAKAQAEAIRLKSACRSTAC
jgi:hypothetical protein